MKRLMFSAAALIALASTASAQCQSQQLSGAICYGQQQQVVQQYVQPQAVVVQRVVTPYVQQQVVQKVVAQPVYAQAQVVQQVNAGYGSSQAVVVGRQKAGLVGRLGVGRQRTVQRSVTKTRG
jgi:hypothetical protein